jgi:4-carboxymuconolactone decarboxylase
MATEKRQRFPVIPEAQWTDAQRKLIQEYRQTWRGQNVAVGGRPVGGPLDATLRAPVLASRLAKVSDHIRGELSLPRKLRELVIIIVSQYWNCEYELHVHAPFGREAGLSQDVLDAVTKGVRPAFASDDEAVVYDLTTEILVHHKLTDATFERALRTFTEQQVIELVGVAGYYGIVSMFFVLAEVKPAK